MLRPVSVIAVLMLAPLACVPPSDEGDQQTRAGASSTPDQVEPPDSEPAGTEPPDTEPPDTEPPDTEPPDTEPPPGGELCGLQTVTFWAGQTIDVGTVTVSHDADNLYVLIALVEGWEMTESHLAVADSPEGIPQGPGGPVPGMFPYSQSYDPPADADTYVIPLSELGLDVSGEECVSQGIAVAVHAAVVQVGCDTAYDDCEETAWSDGPDFPGPNWATYTDYEVTCCEEPPPSEGCTLTQGFWKNHSEAWPIDGGELCGASYMDILTTPPRGDAWVILAHQWIAATLNAASGADVPDDVREALDEAEDLLEGCEISGDERGYALALKDVLDAYNNGLLGPGHCDDSDEDDDGHDDD